MANKDAMKNREPVVYFPIVILHIHSTWPYHFIVIYYHRLTIIIESRAVSNRRENHEKPDFLNWNYFKKTFSLSAVAVHFAEVMVFLDRLTV